jgi:hypothetical protein
MRSACDRRTTENVLLTIHFFHSRGTGLVKACLLFPRRDVLVIALAVIDIVQAIILFAWLDLGVRWAYKGLFTPVADASIHESG